MVIIEATFNYVITVTTGTVTLYSFAKILAEAIWHKV